MKTGKEGWVRGRTNLDLTSANAGSGSASAASGFSSVTCKTEDKTPIVTSIGQILITVVARQWRQSG